MADQIPPGSESFNPPPQQPERRHRGSEGWIAGVVLLVLGLVFLLNNLGITGFALDNWWALFILIPAVASFSTAYRAYQGNGGHMNESVRGPLVGGLILSVVAAVFLLNLSWSVIWPVFLIIIGVGALLTALAR